MINDKLSKQIWLNIEQSKRRDKLNELQLLQIDSLIRFAFNLANYNWRNYTLIKLSKHFIEKRQEKRI